MATSLVRPHCDAVSMRLSEQVCAVCRRPADCSHTSAHLARVHWFCALHGLQFHSSMYFAAARSAPTTLECWAIVDAWLVSARDAWASGSSLGSWLAWARAELAERRRNRPPAEVRVRVPPEPVDEVMVRGLEWLESL